MLDGYFEHNTLSEEWIGRVPAFVSLRRIEMYAGAHELLDMDNLTGWQLNTMRRVRQGFKNKEPLT